jgi:hypothetical protein
LLSLLAARLQDAIRCAKYLLYIWATRPERKSLHTT